jgi:hypothetical protein
MFETSNELKSVRASVNPEFDSLFAQGVRAYTFGNWSDAKRWLESGLALKPRDGPAMTLLEFMGETGFIKPSDWPGYRMLTEK